MRHPCGLGPLVSGDRVALLGTAGPPPAETLAAAEELLRGWGLRPMPFDSARAEHVRADYLSGADELRASDFQRAWCDPDCAAIFVVRGGYGTVRMLDLLDVEALRTARAKPVYGSSDVTALHEFLRERIGVASWFTPMIATGDLLDDPVAIEQLRTAVFGPWEESVRGGSALVAGTAEGALIGGNLSLLAMTLAARGRPPIDNTGAIVVLEDVHEETYKLDGYLMSLLRSGWFDGVAGVVLGSWRDCSPTAEIEALCLELLGPLGVPIGSGFAIGHGRGAVSLPLGVPARLEAGTPCMLRVIPDYGKTPFI